eukprot:2037131-Karenia_brevis.AAC.1
MVQRGYNLKRLRRQGASTARYVSSGHNSVGLWGSRVTGLTNKDIACMRSSAASAAMKMSIGQSSARALAASGYQNLDPAYPANVGPVEEWATAVWEGFPSLAILNLALRAARQTVAATRATWGVAADVATVFLLTLERIGWTAESARILITHEGRKLDLLKLAPKAIGRLVMFATQSWTERPALGGGADAQIFWQAYRPLLKRHVAGIWTVHHQRVAVKLVSNGQWPGVQRTQAGPKCGLCGCPWSAYHGVYECDALLARRRQAASETLMRAAAAVSGDEQRRERFAQGVFPHPRAVVPPAQEHGDICWINRPATGLLSGIIFTDGSALGTAWGIPRAGWAAVQVDDFGDLVAAAYGLVPAEDCPMQTIAEAEDYALSMLAVIAMAPLQVYVDRKQTVDTACGGRRVATCAAHPRAHLWVRFFTAYGDEDVQVHKTLGHATAADVHAGRTTEWERKGNQFADKYARRGAELHGTSSDHVHEVAAMADLARQALQWSAEAF